MAKKKATKKAVKKTTKKGARPSIKLVAYCDKQSGMLKHTGPRCRVKGGHVKGGQFTRDQNCGSKGC